MHAALTSRWLVWLKRLTRPAVPFWRAAVNTISHDGTEHAGYLAFLFLLAFFPFLVFLIALTGKMGRTDVGFRIISALLDNSVIPKDAADSLRPRVHEILSGPPQDLMTMAVVGAAWTSSTLVEGIRTVLNRAYGVAAPPPYVFRRLMSLGQFLLLSGLLVAVITLEVVAPGVLARFPAWHEWRRSFGSVAWLSEAPAFLGLTWWEFGKLLVTGSSIILIPAVLYAAVPNIKTRAVPVLPGALVCGLLWAVSGKALSAYLAGVEQVQIIYGSLGGIIASLFFFYLAAIALIYGAELNYLLGLARTAKRMRRALALSSSGGGASSKAVGIKAPLALPHVNVTFVADEASSRAAAAESSVRSSSVVPGVSVPSGEAAAAVSWLAAVTVPDILPASAPKAEAPLDPAAEATEGGEAGSEGGGADGGGE